MISEARKLLGPVKDSDGILQMVLPNEFPASLFYDGVLKRQRCGSINIDDPNLITYLSETIGYIKAAEKIMADRNFDLVILSHCLDYTYGAIAWEAVRKKIETIILYGDFGHQKFIRLKNKEDIFSYPERMSKKGFQRSIKDKKIFWRMLGTNNF